jgi:hypothetical protein
MKSGTIGAVIGFLLTILAWIWLFGGQTARTQTILENHEKRITQMERVQNDLSEIKATLKQMQAEQRILHGKDALGR